MARRAPFSVGPVGRPPSGEIGCSDLRPRGYSRHRRRRDTAKSPGATSARGVGEYEFNLNLAKLIDQSLVDAGFAKTVLLVTEGPSRKGLTHRVEQANTASADLFLSIHHNSVPDRFLKTWEYEGEEREFSDRFKGHSIFISNENPDPTASLAFARLLGKALKARDLRYTPHYTEKFMGSRQRILVDAEVGVYRYDQLIVLQKNPDARGAARSRLDYQSGRGTADGLAEAPSLDQRGGDRGGGQILRDAPAASSRAVCAPPGRGYEAAVAARRGEAAKQKQPPHSLAKDNVYNGDWLKRAVASGVA